MMKHRVGDIDSFCSKLGQNDLEGILKTFCKQEMSYKVRVKVRVRSRKVTKIKNYFSGMRHMIYGYFYA